MLRVNLNEAISLAKIYFTLKLTSILTNEITSVRFLWKTFLKGKLTIRVANTKHLVYVLSNTQKEFQSFVICSKCSISSLNIPT